MNRAFRTTWSGIESIVAAEDVSHAKLRTMCTARDAGYPAKWIEIRVRRAPEYDDWAKVTRSIYCVGESYVNGTKP